jgi:hypothetical protein
VVDEADGLMVIRNLSAVSCCMVWGNMYYAG